MDDRRYSNSKYNSKMLLKIKLQFNKSKLKEIIWIVQLVNKTLLNIHQN